MSAPSVSSYIRQYQYIEILCPTSHPPSPDQDSLPPSHYLLKQNHNHSSHPAQRAQRPGNCFRTLRRATKLHEPSIRRRTRTRTHARTHTCTRPSRSNCRRRVRHRHRHRLRANSSRQSRRRDADARERSGCPVSRWRRRGVDGEDLDVDG